MARLLDRVRAKIEKNTLFGRALVRVRAKNTLLGRALVRIRSEIEKNTLFGRAFFSVRAKIEKTPFLVGLFLGYGQK